jgi:hypothetical protein
VGLEVLKVLSFLETRVPPGVARLCIQLLARVLICQCCVMCWELLSNHGGFHEGGLARRLEARLGQT